MVFCVPYRVRRFRQLIRMCVLVFFVSLGVLSCRLVRPFRFVVRFVGRVVSCFVSVGRFEVCRLVGASCVVFDGCVGVLSCGVFVFVLFVRLCRSCRFARWALPYPGWLVPYLFVACSCAPFLSARSCGWFVVVVSVSLVRLALRLVGASRYFVLFAYPSRRASRRDVSLFVL